MGYQDLQLFYQAGATLEMIASGWNGASLGRGWAVPGGREDCLNPAFITEEKITPYFWHQLPFDGASYRF